MQKLNHGCPPIREIANPLKLVDYLHIHANKACIVTKNQDMKVRKRVKIRNRYNQAPHLTQDTNGKVIASQLDFTNESQEASPFPAGDHKASINKRAQKHNKNKTEIT